MDQRDRFVNSPQWEGGRMRRFVHTSVPADGVGKAGATGLLRRSRWNGSRWSRRGLLRRGGALAVGAALAGAWAPAALAAPPDDSLRYLSTILFADPAFQAVWARTDSPVSVGQANRTWMWGSLPDTPGLGEPYVESPGGTRLVQYFDKSRMEITHPNGDRNSIWYVTNGLIAKELITGSMQLGDATFHSYAPAQVNVAGDLNDPNGPTYATFNTLLGQSAVPTGSTVTQTVDRNGTVQTDASLGSYAVTAKDVGALTHHTVASVFWDLMTSSGTITVNGQKTTGPLFPNPFYATGYPLTESYWTNVLVDGTKKQVLVQVFERRVLTYTPDNPSGWQVEAGNVGLQYHQWRYVQLGLTPKPWNG